MDIVYLNKKKLNIRIQALFKIMVLEGKLVDNALIYQEWDKVNLWNERKKATAKALRKFVMLKSTLLSNIF